MNNINPLGGSQNFDSGANSPKSNNNGVSQVPRSILMERYNLEAPAVLSLRESKQSARQYYYKINEISKTQPERRPSYSDRDIQEMDALREQLIGMGHRQLLTTPLPSELLRPKAVPAPKRRARRIPQAGSAESNPKKIRSAESAEQVFVAKGAAKKTLALDPPKPLKPTSRNKFLSFRSSAENKKRVREEPQAVIPQPLVSPVLARFDEELVVDWESIDFSNLTNIPPGVMSLDPYVISPDKKSQGSPLGYRQLRRESGSLEGGVRRKLFNDGLTQLSSSTGFAIVDNEAELQNPLMGDQALNALLVNSERISAMLKSPQKKVDGAF